MDFSGGSYLKSLFVSRITSLEKSVHLFNALVLINVVCFDRFLGFSEWVSFVCWENLHLCRWRRSPAVIYSEIVHILCFGMRSNLIWNFAHLNALGGKNTLIFAWSSCRGPHHDDQSLYWYLHFGFSSNLLLNLIYLAHKSTDQAVRIPFFSSWSCSAGPSLLTDNCAWHVPYLVLNSCSSLLARTYVFPCCPLGLSQQNQDFILMILGSACTKTGPEIVRISTV